MNNPKGFALIELMAVIVLVGIIASFSTFFLYTGFNGYINTKNATEGALNAQMALDRISMELRNIREIIPTPSNTSITYKSETLTGTWTLKLVGDELFINENENDYKLLEKVSSFSLTVTSRDLDHRTPTDQEIAEIGVEFRISDISDSGRVFKTNIFPRNMVKKTW
ncbi:MAG: type II secretion system protein [Desulfobacterales bacterium]|jgi:prepilin-type N-terminal cleavage/methylation domain-containing protein